MSSRKVFLLSHYNRNHSGFNQSSCAMLPVAPAWLVLFAAQHDYLFWYLARTSGWANSPALADHLFHLLFQTIDQQNNFGLPELQKAATGGW